MIERILIKFETSRLCKESSKAPTLHYFIRSKNIHRPSLQGSRMRCDEAPSPQGTFSKLPPELRYNIWRFLMPELRPPYDDEVREERERLYIAGKGDYYPNRLSILRTSHSLYEEVSHELYRSELCFYVCPKEDIVVVAAKGLPSSEICHFTNTPLDRFPKITVEIQAPVKDDPGQVILGRDSVWRIVSLFMDFIKEQRRQQRSDQSNKIILPRIDIKLLDQSSATWFDAVADDWQRSIPEYPEEDDIDFFLSPFRFVRGIGCAHIQLPDGLDEDLFFTMRELVTGMQLPDEFGTRLYATHYFESEMDDDDPMILFDEEEKFNKLQDACSYLHGETARMAKVRSAGKGFTLFDIQNNHQVAPIGPPRIEQDICYSSR